MVLGLLTSGACADESDSDDDGAGSAGDESAGDDGADGTPPADCTVIDVCGAFGVEQVAAACGVALELEFPYDGTTTIAVTSGCQYAGEDPLVGVLQRACMTSSLADMTYEAGRQTVIDDGYMLEELDGPGEKAFFAIEMDGSSATLNAVQGELFANMVIADSPGVEMTRECMIALVEDLLAVE